MTYVGIVTELLRVASDHVKTSRPYVVYADERIRVIERLITLIDCVQIRLSYRPNMGQTMSYPISVSCVWIVYELIRITDDHIKATCPRVIIID